MLAKLASRQLDQTSPSRNADQRRSRETAAASRATVALFDEFELLDFAAPVVVVVVLAVEPVDPVSVLCEHPPP